jgi:nucleotide-binding universal stress UspA family protein
MTTARAARPAIVVGIDGSTSALQATRWAATEAALRGLPLRLVHATDPPAVYHPTTATGQRDYVNALRDQGRHWVRDAAAVARSIAATLDITDIVHAGGTAGVLIEESAGAWLSVLGSRGLGGFPGLRAGSVAVAVAEYGESPVVVIRGRTVDEPPPSGGPVVVGVDGSPASETAVDFAFDTASFRGAELIAVHCWSEVSFDGGWAMVPLAANWPEVAEEERLLLDERMAGWQEKYPDVPVRRLVVRGRPVRALLEEAERSGAQLIVVGSRGRGGALTEMGMGSTSQALLRYGECPVAVVRPTLKGDKR